MNYWPLVILVLSMGLVIFLITVLRVHAFLALILSAIAAGLLAPVGSLPGERLSNHWITAVELSTTELGTTAGKIAVVIALASVIGMCLMESGAADKVVRRFLAVFGEKRAGFALFTSSYILSIPIFFDTFFMLLLPIAQALALRLKRGYLLFLMAICCSGLVTHVLIAPHPGPLAMAETLKLDLGLTIAIGLVIGAIPALCAWLVSCRLNCRMEIALHASPGTTLADLEQITACSEKELPSLGWSLAPILLPIVLISAASFTKALHMEQHSPILNLWVDFFGNRNVALILSTVIAMILLARHKGYSVAEICTRIGAPLETAGVIILITSAGGAYGLMLKNAGVGESIQALVAGREVNLVLLAWLVSSLIRIAQGSATVAMLSTSAIMLPIISASALPFHPIYLFMAIGFGSANLSWMNDSGFWVISKLTGMTEKETLRTWTVISTTISISGVITTLLCSKIFPMAMR